MPRIMKSALVAGGCLISAAIVSSAYAQDAGDTPETLEEIIVTAQRRAERLQDVPLAVTALTGATLANQQINDTINLTKLAPSLAFQAGNNPSNNSFRIRGVGTALFSQGVEPSVAVVVDGVVQARQAQNFTSLADIERIEILRGPQGTLFGKNATAGVINVVTARPSSTFTAEATAQVAEHNEYRLSGTVSGPISDTVRGRMTVFYNDMGGYHINAADGSKEGASEGYGVRGKLEWDAGERLNLLAIAEYRKQKDDCCQYGLVQANSPARAALYSAAGIPITVDTPYTWNSSDSYAYSDQKTFSLEAGLDLDWAKLTSITAFQDFDMETNFEGDRLGASVPIFLSATSNALYDYNTGRIHTRQSSQELRLDSQGDGPITYTTGLYYAYLDLDRPGERRRSVCTAGVIGQPCAAANVRYQSLVTQADFESEHMSAFGQAEARIGDHLKLIGGARLLHERVEVNGRQVGVLVPGDAAFGTIAPAGRTKGSDTAFTGKVGAKYEFSSRAQTYATYTHGYKGQGADTEITTNFSNNPLVLPETVDAYEVGFKGSTQDGIWNFAAAIFQADYKNLQVQANRSDPTTGVAAFQATNAGSSTTKGIEIETTFRPSRDFSIRGGVTYLDPSLNADGLNCPIQYQTGAATIAEGGARPVNTCYRYQYRDAAGRLLTSGAIQDVRSGETPATPHWRVTVSPRYEHDIGVSWRGFIQGDVAYQSATQFAIEQDPNQVQKAYTIVNLSVGLSDPEAGYTLTFFVKNLFDQNYYVTSQGSGLLPTQLNLVDKYAIRPKDADRYMGATLNISF